MREHVLLPLSSLMLWPQVTATKPAGRVSDVARPKRLLQKLTRATALIHTATLLFQNPRRFDVSKPWSLGVFLTCQVRLEQPAHSSRADRSQQSLSPVAGAAGVGTPTEAAGAGAAAGDVARRFSSSSASSGYFGSTGSDGAGKGAGKSGAAAAAGGIGQQQQQQLVMQLFDFGFVSTNATIAVREAGAANKRTEKSWEHAVVSEWKHWQFAQASLKCFGRLTALCLL